MVQVDTLIPTLKLDVRYATTANFSGQVLYDTVQVYLVEEAANALMKVAQDLAKQDLGILLFDAYRPLSVQRKMWKIFPDANFVADPSKGSRHNRGAAVDLSLYQLSTGKRLVMPTEYDDFTKKASHQFMDLSQEALQNRTILKNSMEKHGYNILESEWWHYDFRGWEAYPVLDIDFNQIQQGK